MAKTSLTPPTRTRARFETEAKFLAGDSDGTVSSLWSTTESEYAFTRAYEEICTQLLHKRHPCTRQVTFLDSAASNPVVTYDPTVYPLSDIEMVEVDDGGVDLSSGGTPYVVRPRDWEFMQNALYGGSTCSVPSYYTLRAQVSTFSGMNMEMWMATTPTTGGTNSVRVIHYGIEKWSDVKNAPCFPTEFDVLLALKTAHYLRLMKDLELNDLLTKIVPLEMRLMQAAHEPKVENDYQIPAAGRMNFRTKYATKAGWIRRY